MRSTMRSEAVMASTTRSMAEASQTPSALSPARSTDRLREASPSKSPPRHPLEIMAFDELTEASIELAVLPTSNVIVRSQLDVAMQRQRWLVESGNIKKRVTLDQLKERQVAW